MEIHLIQMEFLTELFICCVGRKRAAIRSVSIFYFYRLLFSGSTKTCFWFSLWLPFVFFFFLFTRNEIFCLSIKLTINGLLDESETLFGFLFVHVEDSDLEVNVRRLSSILPRLHSGSTRPVPFFREAKGKNLHLRLN